MFSFFGGEPMMAWDTLREVVLHAERIAAEAGVTALFRMHTNGMLIKEEHLQFFEEHDLIFILSIDGNKAMHDRQRVTASGTGSFEVIASFIRSLARSWSSCGSDRTMKRRQACSRAHPARAQRRAGSEGQCARVPDAQRALPQGGRARHGDPARRWSRARPGSREAGTSSNHDGRGGIDGRNDRQQGAAQAGTEDLGVSGWRRYRPGGGHVDGRGRRGVSQLHDGARGQARDRDQAQVLA